LLVLLRVVPALRCEPVLYFSSSIQDYLRSDKSMDRDPPSFVALEPRYVPKRERHGDPDGYAAYRAWEIANPNDPRVVRRQEDPEPAYVRVYDRDIDRHAYSTYREWARRHPDISRGSVEHARPGDLPDPKTGRIPFYGAKNSRHLSTRSRAMKNSCNPKASEKPPDAA